MAESNIALTEGSGAKRAHTFQRSIAAVNVEDEVVIPGESYLGQYNIITAAAGVSTATANSHILEIMAGSSLNVYIRWIQIEQVTAATASAIDVIELVRLSTAGTGGGALTPAPNDTTDSASGATAMTLATVKGTETTFIDRSSAMFIQTVPTGGPGSAPYLCRFDFAGERDKALRIPAGTANGIAIKNPTARAAATVLVRVRFIEANF